MQNRLIEERIERDLLDAVDSCRAGIMDTIHLELCDAPNWKFIRARLLRCFGDRGLSGRITEILNTTVTADGASNDIR